MQRNLFADPAGKGVIFSCHHHKDPQEDVCRSRVSHSNAIYFLCVVNFEGVEVGVPYGVGAESRVLSRVKNLHTDILLSVHHFACQIRSPQTSVHDDFGPFQHNSGAPYSRLPLFNSTLKRPAHSHCYHSLATKKTIKHTLTSIIGSISIRFV